VIESFEKELWIFKDDYNIRVLNCKRVNKGIAKFGIHVWTLHLPNLVHPTILSLGESMNRWTIWTITLVMFLDYIQT
jgi:hypothetical protein